VASLRCVLVSALLAVAGCGESTGPRVAPAVIGWLEWPAAVTVSTPGSLRVSGSAECPYHAVFGVRLTGGVLHVSAEGRNPDKLSSCQVLADGSASSAAGTDTVLALPALPPAPVGDNAVPIWAAVASAPAYGATPVVERLVGHITVTATADVTPHVAGSVFLFSDTTGCWRVVPLSAQPQPRWVFAKPVPLVPGDPVARRGFLLGRLVPVNPPVCGEQQAVDVFELDVDATPYPPSGYP
jgi:hypothetical protein